MSHGSARIVADLMAGRTPPMAFSYYRNISAGDLDAIVAYRRSLPAR